MHLCNTFVVGSSLFDFIKLLYGNDRFMRIWRDDPSISRHRDSMLCFAVNDFCFQAYQIPYINRIIQNLTDGSVAPPAIISLEVFYIASESGVAAQKLVNRRARILLAFSSSAIATFPMPRSASENMSLTTSAASGSITSWFLLSSLTV